MAAIRGGRPRWRRAVVTLALGLVAALAPYCALAQEPAPATEFEPRLGQPGKDVVWVPTPQTLVDKMLDMAKVSTGDLLIDLGSGDGRLVITAAKRGVRAHGIEYEPEMVELSRRNAEKEGVSALATFTRADIFESDFSRATVITMFLLPNLNLRLRPQLLELAPGTRIVSNAWRMADWEPDETGRAQDCDGWCTAYLWIVPAKVSGTWTIGSRRLTIRQTFQMIEGTLASGKSVSAVRGKVLGDRLVFTAAGRQYAGRLEGDVIEGTVGSAQWKAVRASPRGRGPTLDGRRAA